MNTEQLIEKHLFGKKPEKLDDGFDRIQHLSVNDVRAMLDEHAKCVLADVSTRLSSSLGEVDGNAYDVVFDKYGSFWINHKEVGSGEPLKQWIDGVIEEKLRVYDVRNRYLVEYLNKCGANRQTYIEAINEDAARKGFLIFNDGTILSITDIRHL